MAHRRPADHPQHTGRLRTRRGDDVLRHRILGTPEVFVAFLTTYCVGNLIGSALAKPLTDWKCKSQRLLVDERPAGGRQSGKCFRADARKSHHVRLHLRDWRTASARDANPVGDDVRHR